MALDEKNRLEASRQYWDEQAESFDLEADHGLRDPLVFAAWRELLAGLLPSPPAGLLDIGCGTGSLSSLLAQLDYSVTGIDLSPAMIARAAAKAEAAGLSITFVVGDAFIPSFAPVRFEVIVCRHLLWALPDPAVALQRWAALLRPGGRLLLIEGFWQSGGGLHAEEVIQALPVALTLKKVEDLSDRLLLWGRPVADERYLVAADLYL